MSSKSTSTTTQKQCARVFVRCRPINQREARYDSVLKVSGQNELVLNDHGSSKSKSYTFDRVFGPETDQFTVYQTVVDPLISDVLNGYNCTVMAYGQTGTGKTFTMEGELDTTSSVFDRVSRAGIIPRAVSKLFDELNMQQAEYTVRISLLELYNEELYDLLSPDDIPPKLRLFDDAAKKGSVIVQGQTEILVHSQAQAFEELLKGSLKRQVAATQLNANSSRSHTVFCVTVHTKESLVEGEEFLKTGKLYLVDLAGSENIGRSGAVEKRAREAGNINQSLLTLGRVISCLVEHQPHVPYRESKLTRLLQDSLGGRTKVSIIATVSAAQANFEETASTLDYAYRAKSITNRPEVNRKVSKKAIVEEYQAIITDLMRKLELNRKGVGIYIAHENYQDMMNRLQQLRLEVTAKVAEVRAHDEEMTRLTGIFDDFKVRLEEKTDELRKVKERIQMVDAKTEIANQKLSGVSADRREAGILLEKLVEHESASQNHVKALIEVTAEAHQDSMRVHDKIERISTIVKTNIERTHDFFINVKSFHKTLLDKMQDIVRYGKETKDHIAKLEEMYGQSNKHVSEYKETFRKSMEVMLGKVKYFHRSFEAVLSLEVRMKEEAARRVTAAADHELEALAAYERNLSSEVSVFSQSAESMQLCIAALQDEVQAAVIRSTDISRSCSEQLTEHLKKLTKETESKTQSTKRLIDEVRLSREAHTKSSDTTLKMMTEVRVKAEDALRELNIAIEQSIAQEAVDKEQVSNQELALSREVESSREIGSQVAMCPTIVDSYVSELEASRSLVDALVDNRVHEVVGIAQTAEHHVREMDRATEELKNGESLRWNLHQENVEAALRPRETISRLLSEQEALITDVVCEIPQLTDTCVNQGDSLGQFLTSGTSDLSRQLNESADGISAACTEVQNLLNQERDMVNEFINSRVEHYQPTGLTPARKEYKLPQRILPLPSPVTRKIEDRVKRTKANLKRFTKISKRRVPLLGYADDECVSDTEVARSSPGRGSDKQLVRSFSLSNLNSDRVFNKPYPVSRKIPRKIRQ